MKNFAARHLLYPLIIILINSAIFILIFNSQLVNNNTIRTVLGAEHTQNPYVYENIIQKLNNIPKVNSLLKEECIVINEFSKENFSLDYQKNNLISDHCKSILKFENINEDIDSYGVDLINYRDSSYMLQRQGIFPTCSINILALATQVELELENLHINPVILGELTNITLEDVYHKANKLREEYGKISNSLDIDLYWRVSAYNNLVTHKDNLKSIAEELNLDILRDKQYISNNNPFTNKKSKYVYINYDSDEINRFSNVYVNDQEMFAIPSKESKSIIADFLKEFLTESKYKHTVLLSLFSSENIGHEYMFLDFVTIDNILYLKLAEPTGNASTFYENHLDSNEVFHNKDKSILFEFNTAIEYITRITTVS